MASPAETPASDLERLSERLKAVSNPKRLALLRHLRTPLYLEEMASALGIARQSAQEHAGTLLAAGLLAKRPAQRESGPVVEYHIVQPEFFSLVEDLRSLFATLPDADVFARTLPGAAAKPGRRADVPELVIVGGLRPGAKATLHRGSSAPPLLIGRDPAAGLALEWDLTVSNRHAEVRGTPKGHAVVDLFSRNGTFLNDERLAAGEPRPLAPGDILQVGRTSIVYR